MPPHYDSDEDKMFTTFKFTVTSKQQNLREKLWRDQLWRSECASGTSYRIFSNLIRTSFCRFFKRKKKLVRGSNPHLSFKRPLRAATSEVARWVSAAWKAIPESIIFRSFKKCCISNALDGSEDDILLEGDGEHTDDSDWVTGNDSVVSDDGESDE